MKKSVSIMIALLMLLGVAVLPVSAWEYVEREPTAEETEAGFMFDCVWVRIKDQYKSREFTAEDFGSDLVDRIEVPNPYNPEHYESFERWEMRMVIYIREDMMTKENYLEMYKTVKNSEYVRSAQVNYIDEAFPVYPSTPEEIGIYSGKYHPYMEPDHDNYDSEGAGMIYNPYYKYCGNGLLEFSYSIYHNISRYMGDIDYVGWFIDTYLEKEESFITVILTAPEDLPDVEGAMREYNTGIIKEYLTEENILYVADTVPAVVLRVTPEDKNALRRIDDIVFIGDAFFTSKGGFELAVAGEYTLGNVTGRQDEYYEGEKIGSVKFVNAADARLVLRFVAGLEKPEKELKRFYYCADMNFDGKIDAADARLILRTAAGLEKEYELAFGYASSWYDPMGRAQ